MKKIELLIIGLCSVMLANCGEEGYKAPDEYCGELTGKTVDKEIGRVYHYSDPYDPLKFYYIGNPDTTYRWGGIIPCNSLPEEYIGDLVRYSGELSYQYSKS